MPKLERTAFEGSELNRVHSSIVTAREVRLMVFKTGDALFRRFIDATYDAHVYRWESAHPQGSFTVSREEWMRYAFTALRSRLARVNDDHGQIRSDDEWQIPAMWASVFNALGRVTTDEPAILYTPVWNPAFDAEVLPRNEWARVTGKMRGLAADREFVKFLFVKHLSGDRTGDDAILTLIPVQSVDGEIVELRSKTMVDGVSAFIYLASGFMPEIFEGLTLDQHPRLIDAQKRIEVSVVEYGAEELGLRAA